jgi:hypothetical protein
MLMLRMANIELLRLQRQVLCLQARVRSGCSPTALAGVNGDGLCPLHAFMRSSKLIFAGMQQFPASWHTAVSQTGKVSVSVTALGSREFPVLSSDRILHQS